MAARHRQAVEDRARAWSLLSCRARRALSAWRDVAGCVSCLNPDAAPDDRVFQLDVSAAMAAMEWCEIPHGEPRRHAWRLIQLAHDVEYHGLRHRSDVCGLHVLTDTAIDPSLSDPSRARPAGAPFGFDDGMHCIRCAAYWQGFEFVR